MLRKIRQQLDENNQKTGPNWQNYNIYTVLKIAVDLRPQ